MPQPEIDGTDLATLLRSAADGDRISFQQIYDRTSPKLFGVALRISGNRTIAEDVVQEAYLKIWRNADRFDPRAGGAMTWMATIVRNAAIDRIRADRIERNSSGDDEDALAGLVAPGSGDSVAQLSLQTCLGKLDEDARRCVLLAYVHGFSRDDLSERMERPVGTIKTILHRSIKVLRECLDPT